MEPMITTTFDDLLYQAEQLTAEIDGETGLPRIERNLKQLAEAGQSLWSRTAQSTSRDANDSKASVLLGSKGYDLQKVSHQLEHLSSSTALSSTDALKEADIKGFLRSERENCILSVIDEVNKSTYESVDKRYWDKIESEWEEEKMKILNSLVGSDEISQLDVSLHSTKTVSVSPTLNKTRFYETSFVDTKSVSAMDQVEMAYANEMMKYVDQIVQGGTRYNIIEQFLNKVSKEVSNEQIIIEFWEMIYSVISNDLPIQNHRDAYFNRTNNLFQSAVINKGRRFLEAKYRSFIEGTVYGEPKSGQLSAGAMYQLIRNYLNTKVPSWLNMSATSTGNQSVLNTEDGLVDGHPIWSFIWHCLRAGSVEAAVQVASQKPITSLEFVKYLRDYQGEDRRLTRKLENEIRLLFKKSVRLSSDPYKRAVFCLLGCCDVADEHNDVIEKVEDLIWFRLGQVKLEDNDGREKIASPVTLSPASFVQTDRLTLEKLQRQLGEEYGEAHFNATQQPLAYFKVLFLTCQFEAAIEFLSRIDRFRTHAVHAATALNELGLLTLPNQHLNVPVLSKLSTDPSGIKRLNYARLISIYTRKFEVNNPTETIYYLYLLRNVKSSQDKNLFVTSVSRLVRDTKEFDKLLGYMSHDGCRIPGIVDKFHDVNKIIDQVAVDCESSGLFEEAVRLYDLESKHDKVFALLNRLLGAVVSERKVPGSKRERIELFAIKLAERYCSQGHNAPRELAATFYLLLDLMTFFDYYHKHTFADALDTIKNLKVLPFRTSDVVSKVNEFSQYDEEIRRNLPDILLATMNILYNQYKDIKTSSPQTVNKFGLIGELDSREKFLSDLRQYARVLVTFAGMIPYRMPDDTNARLVQLEVLMN